jgi:hypothetical protein
MLVSIGHMFFRNNLTAYRGVIVLVVSLLLCVGLLVAGYVFIFSPPTTEDTASFSGEEVGFEAEPQSIELSSLRIGKGRNYSIDELQTYTRTPGPWRVGLQIGHWQNDRVPPELNNLTGNTGATWNGVTEAEVIYDIVMKAVPLLESAGVVVEVLPAMVPKGYKADAFVSVHADGNQNSRISGFKLAGPRIDYSGRADVLVRSITAAYREATGLAEDSAITNRMTAYYAFNWPRYEHAIHPHTPAAILETGFLTSPIDRAIIVDNPDRAAAGLAEGILDFLADTTEYPVREIRTPALPIIGTVVCAPLRAERRLGSHTYDCLPSVESPEGFFVALAGVASTTPHLGERVMTAGEYMPAQSLDTYFWFPYDVIGMVTKATEVPIENTVP